MSPDQIAAIKAAHPDTFAAKRLGGLTETQAAQVIQAQLDYDKENPPGPKALAKARNLVDLIQARLQVVESLKAEAHAAIAEAARLNPELPPEELPSLPLDLVEDFTKLQKERDEATLLAHRLQEELDTALATKKTKK